MKQKISDKLLKLYCTFLYLGLLPFAPGTFGTLGAVIPYYLISEFKSIPYLITIIIFALISIYITNQSMRFYKSDDPGEIVIDEACGYLFTMFMVPFNWVNVLIGFLLFRFFDILKPYPIRKIEKLRDGYGIILDDVLAGIYSNIVLLLIIRL